MRCLPADDERYKEIPPKYHLAYALDDEKSRGIAGAFGYPNFLYKVRQGSVTEKFFEVTLESFTMPLGECWPPSGGWPR